MDELVFERAGAYVVHTGKCLLCASTFTAVLCRGFLPHRRLAFAPLLTGAAISVISVIPLRTPGGTQVLSPMHAVATGLAVNVNWQRDTPFQRIYIVNSKTSRVVDTFSPVFRA